MAMGRKLATYLAEQEAKRERKDYPRLRQPFVDPYADDPCRTCGLPVGARVYPGRRRFFCSDRCRQAWNQGRGGWAADREPDLPAEEIERRFQRAKAQIQERRRGEVVG